MRTMPRALVALFAALAATVCGAQAFVCNDFAALTFSPRNPGPEDTIYWSRLDSFQGVPPGWSTIARAYVLGGNQVLIDIVVTSDLEAFPGYEVVEPFPRSGSFGPLPVGRHVVGSTVRTFDLATQASTPQCVGRFEGITVSAQPAPTASAPVVEYYHAALDHYFMTQDLVEIAALDAGSPTGWTRTAREFIAYLPGRSDGRGGAVARFYGDPAAGLDTHVYTVSSDEIFELVNGRFAGAWRYETPNAFELPDVNRRTGECPPGTRPLYRLWNGRSDTNHRYTTDMALKQQLAALGWIPEGWGPDSVFACAL